MKAAIKRLHSPDVHDLKNYHPTKGDEFGFLLQMIVGPEGEKGEESFDIMVCTPQWIISNHSKEEIIFGRHYMIVFEYQYQTIFNKLSEYVESISGNSWDELAQLINRIGHWEFEDYKV